jgi:hypothetical protein
MENNIHKYEEILKNIGDVDELILKKMSANKKKTLDLNELMLKVQNLFYEIISNYDS